MKKSEIIYLSTSTIPSTTANSVHVMKMVSALAAFGHNVTVIADKQKNEVRNSIRDIFKFYGVKDNFAIKEIWYPKIKKLGWILYGYFSYYLIKKRRPDLVYARDPFGAYLCVLNGFKVIFECHSSPVGMRDKIIFPKLFCNKNTKKIVVISNALKEILINQYPFIDRTKLIVAHDGVDLENFKGISNNTYSRSSLGFQSKDFVCGYIGSLYKGRGVGLILKMAKSLPQTKFLIIGGNEKEINEQKKELERQKIKNVIFGGFIPNGELGKYWRVFDVLLMPYQKKLETTNGGIDTSSWMSPLKMFEYMASGVPIISSDLPVLNEVLKNEENALMIDPENVEDWITAIKRVMSDKALAQRLSANSEKDVQKYSWQNRVMRILSLKEVKVSANV